ncbi:homocysteine S-methyltransferase [Propionicicella superfundia]|uniref:homocysteine S-methyltransferase n=1 Tax=Propionicicella superfundia TaxID=348582 RepID=UPI000412598C|nr:homocysteine S-methyltransferase [Propionicicella superfundia]
MSTLARTIARRTVVLDGGLATLLESHGHDLTTDLWSARLLRDAPGAICDAHKEYYEAGAEVATTASYQASFDGFAAAGIDRAEATRLLTDSVRLAAAARDEVAPDGWVAASVGPYGAALADGSEYRGDDGLTVAQLRDWHRPRLEILADAGADVLALETIPGLAEVEALLAEVDGTGMPAWLSLTADGDRTRTGEPLREAFRMAADVAEIIAVGVNCCDPRQVRGAIADAVSVALVPGVAYPNSGEAWDASTHAWSGEAAFDAELVRSWITAGAGLVGGCCRVGPDQIARLAAVVSAAADDAGTQTPTAPPPAQAGPAT